MGLPCLLIQNAHVPCDMRCMLPATAQCANDCICTWAFITGWLPTPMLGILASWVMATTWTQTRMLLLKSALLTLQSPSDQSFAEAEARKLLTHLLLQRHWWVCSKAAASWLTVGWNPVMYCAGGRRQLAQQMLQYKFG